MTKPEDKSTLVKDKSAIKFLRQLGLIEVARFIYQLPTTILGVLKYYLTPRKKFVIILSPMRSGSTLLKALLAEAPDIEQIPESEFQLKGNRFYIYYKFSRLSSKPIIVLKHPSNYVDYLKYPLIPKGKFKLIILIRNPIDTIISLQKMNPKIRVDKSVPELIDYWKTTATNLANLNIENAIKVNYDELTSKPVEVTKRLFNFIESEQQEGVNKYSKPRSYEWQWKKDDGGDVIKSLKVQKNTPDYSKHKALIEEIKADKELVSIAKHFGFNLND